MNVTGIANSDVVLSDAPGTKSVSNSLHVMRYIAYFHILFLINRDFACIIISCPGCGCPFRESFEEFDNFEPSESAEKDYRWNGMAIACGSATAFMWIFGIYQKLVGQEDLRGIGNRN